MHEGGIYEEMYIDLAISWEIDGYAWQGLSRIKLSLNVQTSFKNQYNGLSFKKLYRLSCYANKKMNVNHQQNLLKIIINILWHILLNTLFS